VFFVGFRSDEPAGWAFHEATHSQDALLASQFVDGAYWDRHGIHPREGSLEDQCRDRGRRIVNGWDDRLPWRTVRDVIADLPEPTAAEGKRVLNHRLQPGARPYVGHSGSPLDELAKTLKAGDHGVPGGENMLRRADDSVRYFTVRESARLQTFPDDYVFHGSWTETMRQLGNAVPVRLAEVVAQSVASHLSR